jgi:hypothetical protein
MSPLRRAECFERRANPERVVPGTATSWWNSLGEIGNPWRDLDGLVCPNHRSVAILAEEGV